MELVKILKDRGFSEHDIKNLVSDFYEKEVLENKFKVLAHLYILIDRYTKDYKLNEKNKYITKKWIYELYYEGSGELVTQSKKFIVDLLGPDIGIDFSYDNDILQELILFLKMDYNSIGTKVYIAEKEYTTMSTVCTVCITDPCCCRTALDKCSFADFQNVTVGSTHVNIVLKEDKKLVSLHSANKYQQKRDYNKDEIDFIDYIQTSLNLTKIEKTSVNNFWNIYKRSKFKDAVSIKIRNKYVHFLYVLKLVLCCEYARIFEPIFVSSVYYNRIKLCMLCNQSSFKLHSGIEVSFDKFFSSHDSAPVFCYRANHEENKVLKIKLGPKFDDIIDESKIDKVKRRIANEIKVLSKDSLYDILKSEGLKVTKKQIEECILKYY
jgi:hypothetical protein